MTISLITFCSEDMARSACVCADSALQHGADTAEVYTYERLKTTDFYRDNEPLLSHPRGCGYWGWKPFIIAEQMAEMRDGDYVIYADAGVQIINNLNFIIDRMDSDIFLFGNNYEHAHWCKADTVHEIWPSGLRDRNNPGWFCFGKQAQASVIFFRINDHTRAFVKEWLDWCLFEGGRLIDDSPSFAPNHPEFREHRHDQAILTTMAYRDGIKLHWWPAEYNDGAFIYDKLPEYVGDDYPILFHHHRRRNHEWSSAA